MELASTITGASGPLVAAMGAALLAYDVWRAPSRWWEEVYFPRGRLQGHREVRDMAVELHRRLPVPPYSAEAVERFVQKINEQYETNAAESQADEDKRELKRRMARSNRGFLGFGLIVVGSFLQAASVSLG